MLDKSMPIFLTEEKTKYSSVSIILNQRYHVGQPHCYANSDKRKLLEMITQVTLVSKILAEHNGSVNTGFVRNHFLFTMWCAPFTVRHFIRMCPLSSAPEMSRK